MNNYDNSLYPPDYLPEPAEYMGTVGLTNVDTSIEEEREAEERSIQSELERLMEMENIADILEDELLIKIGERVVTDYEIDEKSRSKWLEQHEEGLKLASLIAKNKEFPWPNCSNVIFPLITQSAIQFAARSYSTIIQGQDVVKGKVIGDDPDGAKAKRAERIGGHMSFQLLEQMDNWEHDMDIMLTVLPIVGTTFKKSWYNPATGKNVSQYISAKDVVVNNNTSHVLRMTHVYDLFPNEIVERERGGVFKVIEYTGYDTSTENQSDDEDAPRTFLEQHGWWDLDEDGYKEPYIITVHKDSRRVVRMVARWDSKGVTVSEKGDVIKIEPVEYFTMYPFLPPIDGSYYAMGFGILLSQPNKSINSLINQLIDAGTLANTGGGFVSSDVKASGSIFRRIGEYIKVQVSGSTLRESIYDTPVHEPSPTLFSLLELLINFSKELSSSTDLLAGQQPGPNVPATTVLAMIEQGMKVFTSIYKRVFRSFKEELKKLYRLNSMYLSDEEYFTIHDTKGVIAREDYNTESCDVVPVGDPNDISDSQRLMKAQALLQLVGQGFNDNAIRKRYLEALKVPDSKELLPEEGAGQASVEEQMMSKKMELEERKVVVEERKLDLEVKKLEIEEAEAGAEIEKKNTESMKNMSDIEQQDKEQTQQKEETKNNETINQR